MKKIHLILVLLLLRLASYGQTLVGPGTSWISTPGWGFRLTNNASQVGTAYYPGTVNFDQAFTLTFRATVDIGDGLGADGFCVVFAANAWNIAVDRTAHQLGYLRDPGLTTGPYPQYDNKSLAVRYDTWNNGTAKGDLASGADNLSVNQNASFTPIPTGGPVPILPTSGTIKDNVPHNFKVEWTPPNTLKISVDGFLRLTTNFCPSSLWTLTERESTNWGFTSSTGGDWSHHDITDVLLMGQDPVNGCLGYTTPPPAPVIAGGTWSSSNTSVATVDPVTGIVTGVALGTATIIHDITSPCSARITYVIDVKTSDPGTISVPSHFCEGDTRTCSSTHPGGTWSCSSVPAGLATIGSSTGVLTITNPCTTSPGSVTITYTLSTGGCPASTTVTVPVYPAPDFNVIPPDCICSGETYTFRSEMLCACSGCTYAWNDGSGTGGTEVHGNILLEDCHSPRALWDLELKVTNSYGCAITHDAAAFVYPKPEAHATTATTVNICGEGTTVLGVESCGGTGEWSVVDGGGTIFGDPLTGMATYTAADVTCPTTAHVRYRVTGACSGNAPGCPPVDIDYYINVKPRPNAELVVLSCDPLCPGTDATVQICGSPSSTVYCRYTYPGCGPVNDTITLIPSPCDLLGPCQTIVLPRPAGCPATTGLFLVELLSVELNGCTRNLNDAKKITVGYPTATIALVDAPCGDDPYCISITGTPGARVYLSEMFSFDDPSVFPAYVDLPTTGVSAGGTTTTVICGLVIPDMPSGRNRFCITKIEMPFCAGGCTVETAPTYIDELHHPLGCIDVSSKPKPQFDFGVTGTVCPPSPFTLNAHTYSGGIDKLLWTGPAFWSATTMPVPLGDHFQTVSNVGFYQVIAVGTNGCNATKSIRVVASPQAGVFGVSVDGSLCDQAWGTFYVTLTGATGSVVNYTILPSGITGSLPALPPGGASFGISCMGVSPGMTFQITSVTGVGMCPDMGPFTAYPITVNAAPVASLNCSGSICAGPGTPTLTFTGTPGAVVTYGSTPAGSGSGSGVVPSSEVITPPPAVTTSYVITDIVDPATGCHGILPQEPDPCTIAIVPVRPDCPLPTDVVRNAAGTEIMFNAPVAGKLFQSLPGSPAATVGVPYPLPTGTTMFIINVIQIGDCSFGNYDCRYDIGTMGIGFRMATSSPSEEISVDLSDVKQNVAALSIIPNPNTGTFKLSGYLQELTNLKEVTIEVTDMLGKNLLTSVVPVKNGNIQENIAMREVANGVYMIKIKGDHVSQVLRFVIDK